MARGTKGKVVQIMGHVVDIEFPEGTELPEIYNAIEIPKGDGTKLVVEVEQQLGNSPESGFF